MIRKERLSGKGPVVRIGELRKFGFRPAKLGEGSEGKVYPVEVEVISSGGRVRKIPMAEKIFFFPSLEKPNSPFRQPFEQAELFELLKNLNKEKKLGLKIIPTFRLRKKNFSVSIVMTRFETNNAWRNDSGYIADMNRQIKILENEGFYPVFDDVGLVDLFQPVRNSKTGKIDAIISDLGNLQKK